MSALDIVTGFLATLGVVLGAIATWRKANAESSGQKAATAEGAAAKWKEWSEHIEDELDDLHAARTEDQKTIYRLHNGVRRLAGAMSREVTYILDWIDQGANPPPPTREAKILREVIDQLEADMATYEPQPPAPRPARSRPPTPAD